MNQVVAVLGGGLIVHQIFINIAGMRERNALFAQAQTAARQSGKPLAVVGGPYGNWHRRLLGLPAHPYGDVCVDRNPAACAGAPVYLQADIRNIGVPDKTFGCVFASHILEHLPTLDDLARAWRELHRISDCVVVVLPNLADIKAWIALDHYLWVYDLGNGYLLGIERRSRGKRGIVAPDGAVKIVS